MFNKREMAFKFAEQSIVNVADKWVLFFTFAKVENFVVFFNFVKAEMATVWYV